MKNEKLFSVSEVAEMLDMWRSTLHERIKRGTLKAVKIGNAYAIPEDEVKRLKAEQR